MTKTRTAAEAVSLIKDGVTIAINASSGLLCPDDVLKALGERFEKEAAPKNLTTIHPIATGDMFGTKGVDHLAQPGMIRKIIGGSYPSGPSNAEPPLIWQRILAEDVAAYNLPSGVIFDMLREGAALRPGVLTKVGLDTFVDPKREGGAMNASARANPIVRHMDFEGEDWLYFPALKPDVAIIRASTADENGNLTFEQEGATLGAMEMALAAHNNGGLVIAQVRCVAEQGTLKPHDVKVPGILVDVVVEAPDQLQTTATPYDPAISGEIFRPLSSFAIPDFNPGKVIARRVAQELKDGWAVNIGFGISANVPRILLEEGLHGSVTWVIEQGPVGGVPLLDFKFGCASNAEAFVASPHQFSYFQAGGFDCSLLSFLEIGADGSVNVSRLAATPHRTAGAGGFVDITARAKRIIFSGNFNAGAKMYIEDGRLVIDREGKISKIVPEVDQVSFSGPRATETGQDVTYVTERCVLKLLNGELTVTEIAPGIDLQKDVLDQASTPLKVSPELKEMDAVLFRDAVMGLRL
ncbi:acyl-CoA transferase [Gluconobacter thailandicus F149-1 = NBRC 100600]|uniref:Acetate CoA-transferase YdiF n=1 Tax=Gluconobacter thailandicus NBRC 3257 TaxID=1381097 RepID=A0ABQ0IUB4_GLUTH|nr:acyl CoA:acetate/3-ketoacid CoA transferase [Gluconobacter thailandicus]KXV53196.1 CoA-transferase [Gluconobacter thailandicus]GAC88022.1 acyl-CoA transferase [Gluconobacter thailandicus NBRC 3255]GAD25811.1 acyl-CoA transferase [Gluconobacter thailandicus NBRC 3257]GAN93908.1 acyl-CoA transferase [Gluconobacter thailandicus F149-1 = NBRC 100600]GBR60215.1 acyl-CoA transferase [Gluconobacter thailandicus F149-1 = NBRC 100600]